MTDTNKIIFNGLKNTTIVFSKLKNIKDRIYFFNDKGLTQNNDPDFSFKKIGEVLYVTQNDNFNNKRKIIVNEGYLSILAFKFSEVEINNFDKINEISISNSSKILIDKVHRHIFDIKIGGHSNLTIDECNAADLFVEALSSNIEIKKGRVGLFDGELIKSSLKSDDLRINKNIYLNALDSSYFEAKLLKKEFKNIKHDKTSKVVFNNTLLTHDYNEKVEVKYSTILTFLKKEEPLFFINKNNLSFFKEGLGLINKEYRKNKLMLNKIEINNLNRLLQYFNISKNKTCKF